MASCPSSSFPRPWEYEGRPRSLSRPENTAQPVSMMQCRPARLGSLPQQIAHILPIDFLHECSPGCPAQLRSLRIKIPIEKNGPQTIRLRLFVENKPQTERALWGRQWDSSSPVERPYCFFLFQASVNLECRWRTGRCCG
jgi:hypothetical protein